MRIGSHLSLQSGYAQAAITAYKMGAGCFQYFPKNPRRLSIKDFSLQDARRCREICEKNDLVSVAHTPYPTNLCVEGEEVYATMLQSVKNDLDIADACGSLGVVVHFGQYKGAKKNPLYGYQLMIYSLNEILRSYSGKAMILLENNAGQGNKMGITIEELVQVRSLCEKPEHIGFCLDTCHAFASGMWELNKENELVERFIHSDYVPHLKVIHLNDSKYPAFSYRDRHADIGRGMIGEEAFIRLLSRPELVTIPLILETPGEREGGHQAEIEFVRGLSKDIQ
ncbi:deoxyribonuclease IV [Brevibacillus daliensis]|uniref:deoxyribonuclease IV n=1 Tax=Brevibacillus daliensis TaxID=2892995 RepID=UPI001E62CF6C|nr:deoxyribonuclease IV [Brevibacillus daliensis]